jgi:hypothetical protein
MIGNLSFGRGDPIDVTFQSGGARKISSKIDRLTEKQEQEGHNEEEGS